MPEIYVIAPSIGVARIGNSKTGFYVEPEAIGGLPLACDQQGNVQPGPLFVTKFKDEHGAVKRQAARFRLFRVGGGLVRILGVARQFALRPAEQLSRAAGRPA
jgi:L-lysine 6-oxidase